MEFCGDNREVGASGMARQARTNEKYGVVSSSSCLFNKNAHMCVCEMGAPLQSVGKMGKKVSPMLVGCSWFESVLKSEMATPAAAATTTTTTAAAAAATTTSSFSTLDGQLPLL